MNNILSFIVIFGVITITVAARANDNENHKAPLALVPNQKPNERIEKAKTVVVGLEKDKLHPIPEASRWKISRRKTLLANGKSLGDIQENMINYDKHRNLVGKQIVTADLDRRLRASLKRDLVNLLQKVKVHQRIMREQRKLQTLASKNNNGVVMKKKSAAPSPALLLKKEELQFLKQIAKSI